MNIRGHVLIGTAAASLAAVISGCSNSPSPPKVTDFTAGPCQQAAPAVLQIGRLVTTAHKHHGVSKQAQQSFTAAQSQLRALPRKPSGSDALVTAIGFLRLRLDSHSYQPQLLADVSTAQQTMQRSCTHTDAR